MADNIVSIDSLMNAFDELPEGFEQNIPIDDALDKLIHIFGYQLFENNKGPGVAFAIDGPDIPRGYICTHSVGLTKFFEKENVQKYLSEGFVIEAVLTKRESKNSNGRQVYAFVSA